MATRERSPNYPAYSLPASVDFARQLYTKERRSTVSMNTAALAVGSQSLSGPARSKIAALRQYGLVESVSGGKIRISDRAMALVLRKPGDSEYELAAKEAAEAPPLFASLLQDFGSASDDNIAYHLVIDRKFSEDGAKRVIRSLRETIVFANLDTESYNLGNDGVRSGRTTDSDGATSARTHRDDRHEIPARSNEDAPKQRGSVAVSYVWPLPDDIDAHVAFHGHTPTRRAVERLISYLQFMKDDIPDAVTPQNDEAPA